MDHKLPLTAALFVALLSFAAPASAEVDFSVGALVGTGVDTGDADNNPYALQLGAFGELILDDFVIGVRGTRSIGSNGDCVGPNCRDVKDLRSFGGDVGFEWDLAMLHIGPRIGFGRLSERDSDDGESKRVAGYIEPGAVAEINLLMFLAGVDLRYRVAFKESDLNAFLAYARIGLRF
ncbi:MAG: hypothetical protein ABW252_05110 [Polyangiales bacterium]